MEMDEKSIRIYAKSGSGNDPYSIDFLFDKGKLQIICNCHAGGLGKLCHHKLMILRGDETVLQVPGQKILLKKLCKLIEKTEVPKVLEEISTKKIEVESLKKIIKNYEKKLERLLWKGFNSEAENTIALLDEALKIEEEQEKNEDDEKKRGGNEIRLLSLLSEFHSGYTEGWHMCIPSCFKISLDIQLTPRTIEKTQYMLWTQGSRFSFSPGDVIYDTKMAYQDDWKKALQHIRWCFQITESMNAVPTIQGKDGIEPRKPGYVKANVFVPNSEKTRLIKQKEISFSQDEFVRFLIKGGTEV